MKAVYCLGFSFLLLNLDYRFVKADPLFEQLGSAGNVLKGVTDTANSLLGPLGDVPVVGPLLALVMDLLKALSGERDKAIPTPAPTKASPKRHSREKDGPPFEVKRITILRGQEDRHIEGDDYDYDESKNKNGGDEGKVNNKEEGDASDDYGNDDNEKEDETGDNEEKETRTEHEEETKTEHKEEKETKTEHKEVVETIHGSDENKPPNSDDSADVSIDLNID